MNNVAGGNEGVCAGTSINSRVLIPVVVVVSVGAKMG